MGEPDQASKHVPVRSGKLRAVGTAKATQADGHPDIARAIAELSTQGRIAGARSARISARVDPGVLVAAAESLGLAPHDVSAIINASLALAAAPDRFKLWLADPGPALPDDFERAI